MLKKILITAGPTREMLDPVRFLSNLSTGEMGYTLARMAQARGYHVTLISGPTALQPPSGVKFISIMSAEELQCACRKEFPKQDALVMSAAVCDFTVASRHPQKIQRTKIRSLQLRQTPDIVAGLAKKKGKRIVIGFCLETVDWLERAGEKLRRKGLDGIVANYYQKGHVPFGNRRINAAFLDHRTTRLLKKQSKSQVSLALLRWLETLSKKSVKN
ncbi:MAG: phosphopantothenoylcysteine decarboxylase [Candidatus Omnitrophica bacterium]|nr:phosphopantothenoylcysteine decarboxylase [Candidatus Omnitrophota bacterium]